MPKLSSTMEVGTLLQWFKEEGDSVEIGEPLFEIMTDKINIEVEAYDDGIFLKKYYEADDQIPVNAVIGYIGEANEQVPSEPPAQSDEDSPGVTNRLHQKRLHPVLLKPQKHLMKKYVPHLRREKRQRIIM